MATLSDFVDYTSFRLLFTFAICLNFFLFWRIYLLLACLVIGYKLLRPFLESLFLTPLESSSRGVFITGCDSGFGHKLAEYLDGLGFVVFASCLNEQGIGAKRLREIGSKRLHVLEVNVADDRSVVKAGNFVKKNLPKKGLWAIVNNAGINFACDLELTSVDTFEKYLDINLYGAIRVCKQFLPHIRHSKGRIINIASVHGWFSIPRWSVYETSKHGLETVSDSLRLEMKKFGVGVSIIEPGAFLTSGSSPQNVQRVHNDIRADWEMASEEVKRDYSSLDDVLSRVFKPTEFEWPPGNDLMPIVKAIEHAIRSPYPYTRYMIWGTRRVIDVFVIVAKLYNLLPTWIIDEFIAYLQRAMKI